MDEMQGGRMVNALAPEHGEHVARLGVTARLTSSGHVTYDYFGGDHNNTEIEHLDLMREDVLLAVAPGLAVAQLNGAPYATWSAPDL
jgi:hypothetical protein